MRAQPQGSAAKASQLGQQPPGPAQGPAHLHGDGQQAGEGHDLGERLVVAEAERPRRVAAHPQSHEEVDQRGGRAMGDGLEEDPVVEEPGLLAVNIELGQLQALLGTQVLRGGFWGSATQ